MTIPELIERLEKAIGPDRDLDEAISAALFPEHEFMQLKDAPEGIGSMMYRWPNGQQVSALRATSSLDAAIKLCELALPGWVIDLISQDFMSVTEGYRGIGWTVEIINQVRVQGQSSKPAIALCIAILRALQPKEGE